MVIPDSGMPNMNGMDSIPLPEAKTGFIQLFNSAERTAVLKMGLSGGGQ
jgi:hypothetical protein